MWFPASIGFSTAKTKVNCLAAAAEFVQMKKETVTHFMILSQKLKAIYTIICCSSKLQLKKIVDDYNSRADVDIDAYAPLL